MRGASLVRVGSLALLWGSGFLWTKLALRGLTPAQTVVVRLLLGAATLVVIVYALGHRLPTSWGTWLHLGVAAVFGNVAPYLLFALGLREVDSAAGGMLNATTPVWTVLVAFAAGQAGTLSRVQVTGVLVGLLGTVLIFTPWDLGTQFVTWGALACLCAAFSYGVSYVYIAKFLVGRAAGPLTLSAAQLIAASLLSCLLVIPADGFAAPHWRADALVSIAILGVLSTGVAYLIHYRIISDDGPVAASAVIYLLPVVAVALGALFLAERPAPTALGGVAVVLLGVLLTRWHRGRSRPRPGGARVQRTT